MRMSGTVKQVLRDISGYLNAIFRPLEINEETSDDSHLKAVILPDLKLFWIFNTVFFLCGIVWNLYDLFFLRKLRVLAPIS